MTMYERYFIRCIDVSADKTADGLFKEIEKIIEEFKIWDKLVG